MNNNEKSDFSYTYSAKEQQEIKNIRQKYTAHEEDKLETLRNLDRSVTCKSSAVAVTVGVIGALLLGLGMSLFMTDLGESLGFIGNLPLIIGVAVGIVGIVTVCTAYPLYNHTVNRERDKITPEILRLTDELMK